MKIIEVSKEEYTKLFLELKGNIRVCLSDIDIIPDDSEEERIQKINKAFNPEIPLYIDYWYGDGLIRYVKSKK